MAHLIDKDALVAEMNKLLDKGKYHDEYEYAFRDGNNGALYALKRKLDTLEVKEVEEEPVSEDLENTAIQYAGKHAPYDDAMDEVEEAFKAGAQWQKNRMTKNAVEKTVGIEECGHLVIKVDDMCVKYNDKVKVIIIKEE